MTWITEGKRKIETILSEHLNDDATLLCLRYFQTIKAFDSMAQGDGILPLVSSAYSDMLTGFIGNKFFEKHQGYLYPLMVNGFTAWNDFIKSIQKIRYEDMSNEEKLQAMSARRQFHEVACACATLLKKDTTELREKLASSGVL